MNNKKKININDPELVIACTYCRRIVSPQEIYGDDVSYSEDFSNNRVVKKELHVTCLACSFQDKALDILWGVCSKIIKHNKEKHDECSCEGLEIWEEAREEMLDLFDKNRATNK